MNPRSDSTPNIFKTFKLIRYLEFSMHNRYEFEKSYLPQKGIFFLIFYISNINVKKPRIDEKYLIKF